MLVTAHINVDSINQIISIKDYNKKTHSDPKCSLGHKLIAKKGKKVVHHFAHYPGEKCDPWKTGMTHWHYQWQIIVADKSNLEVCIDSNGIIKGNSSFSGLRYNQTPSINLVPNISNPSNSEPLQSSSIKSIPYSPEIGHIADIIKPYSEEDSSPYGNRPMVIEVQHSPMDKNTINEREEYYKHMIWLFDFTPRLVKKGDHNKIAFVDGKISFLSDKVSYVALITAGPDNILKKPKGYCLGDGYDNDIPIELAGTFIIINTRTKYWFETTKPTYFDCGFGILRMIRKLDKGFCLTYYLTYEQFISERMPPVSKTGPNSLETCEWFTTLNPLDLIKINFMPTVIDVPPILIGKDRVSIKHAGQELDCLGLDKGLIDWHYGPYYKNSKEETVDITTSLLMQMNTGMIVTTVSNDAKEEAIITMRVRKFLGVSSEVDISIIKFRKDNYVKVICSKETYGMSEKFKALGMKYRKGTKGRNGKGKTPSYYNAPLSDVLKKLNEQK